MDGNGSPAEPVTTAVLILCFFICIFLVDLKNHVIWHVVVKIIHFSIFCYRLKQELDQRSIERLPILMVCLHQQCEIRNVCENNNLKTVQISFLYQNGYAQTSLKGQCFLNFLISWPLIFNSNSKLDIKLWIAGYT